MKDFLMELFLEHGERAFGYNGHKVTNGDIYDRHFAQARYKDYIEYIMRDTYTVHLPPYKLTAKALEYIKTND